MIGPVRVDLQKSKDAILGSQSDPISESEAAAWAGEAATVQLPRPASAINIQCIVPMGHSATIAGLVPIERSAVKAQGKAKESFKTCRGLNGTVDTELNSLCQMALRDGGSKCKRGLPHPTATPLFPSFSLY